MNVKWIQL